MRKTILHIFTALALLCGMSSCEAYLDKSPDLGLDESDIYKNYESILGFLDECYSHLYRWLRWREGEFSQSEYMMPLTHTDELTACRQGSNFIANSFNKGDWYSTTRNIKWELGMKEGSDNGTAYTPIYIHCAKGIRIANRVIENIDKVVDITDQQRNQVLGQAYFYRAWFYFQLINRWGGMPILDKLFAGGDDNIPRKTYRECSKWMISDFDKAIELLPDMWSDVDFCRPDRAAAMGARAEALLYQASPLFQNGLDETVKMDYDKEVCLEAAKAAQEVLDYIESVETGRHFTKGDLDAYKGIFYLPNEDNFHHEEYIWWERTRSSASVQDRTQRFIKWMETCSQTGAVAQQCPSPTYNITRYFERKGPDGIYYPIDDPRSGYVEDDLTGNTLSPWSNFQDRDPRMYNAMLMPGERWGYWKGTPYYISLWKGGSGYEKQANHANNAIRGFAGMLLKKYTWWQCSSYWNGSADDANGSYLFFLKSFYIRVTEMYLNYAEALFEATGDALSAPAGYKMTPAEALNIVRQRVGVTPIVADYLTADKFRQTYRRERTVELVFEDHRWIDLRRWMIFDEVFPNDTPIYGFVWHCDQAENDANLLNKACAKQNAWIYDNYTDPADKEGNSTLTFHYAVVKMSAEERAFNSSDNRYYLYPFQGGEVASLTNLKQNPGW